MAGSATARLRRGLQLPFLRVSTGLALASLVVQERARLALPAWPGGMILLLVAALIFAGALWFRPRMVLNFGAILFTLLLPVELFVSGGILLSLRTHHSSRDSRALEAPARRLDKPNIYHFVLDEFSLTPILRKGEFPGAPGGQIPQEPAQSTRPFQTLPSGRESLNEQLVPNLAGFTRDADWYPNASANYVVTPFAMASMFAGRMVPPRGNLVTLFVEIGQNGDLLGDARKAGYRIHIYGQHLDYRALVGDRADRIVLGEDTDLPAQRALLFAYWYSVRLFGQRVGVIIHDILQPMFRATHRTAPETGRNLLTLLSRDLTGLPKMGQYVLVHVMLPHPPFVFSPSGRLQPPRRTLAAYQEQIRYTDSLLGDIFGKLRSLQVYESATILVHADHGLRMPLDRESTAKVAADPTTKPAASTSTNLSPGGDRSLVASIPNHLDLIGRIPFFVKHSGIGLGRAIALPISPVRIRELLAVAMSAQPVRPVASGELLLAPARGFVDYTTDPRLRGRSSDYRIFERGSAGRWKQLPVAADLRPRSGWGP